MNHVGIIVEDGNMETATTVEALAKVHMHPLGMYARKLDTAVAVYRPINLTGEETEKITAKASRMSVGSTGL